MIKMHIIQYGGKLFIFHNKEHEPDNMFIDRCWFVARNYASFDTNYAYLKKLSHVYINNKFLKVGYDENVMSELARCV